MRHSIEVGFGFGLTSSVITTLGLIVGLHSSTHSKPAVIGGVLTVAIADAFSDALGIHISEESEGRHAAREIWEATFSAFITKFVFTLTFVAPIICFDLNNAIAVSLIYGLTLLGVFSFYMARKQKASPSKIIGEHLGIALLVVAMAHYAGDWISFRFNQ